MNEDYGFTDRTSMLIRTPVTEPSPQGTQRTSSSQSPDLSGGPQADTVQESTISSDKVTPLVSKANGLTAAIVICTRNRPIELRGCLNAISRLERLPDEVIVVDNSNGNQETESVSREFGVTYIVERETGLSRARNRGMQESHSAIVVYLDDDAYPEKNWLGILLAPFANPQIGVVTGETAVSTAHLLDHSNEACRIVTNSDPHWFEIAAYGGLGPGTNMAIRKESCIGWTVFDERMGRGAPLDGMEELHACVRLVFRGNRAVHLPDAVVVHSSQRPNDVIREARNSFAYSLILFSEYPGYRKRLFAFLVRRLFRRPLGWQRNSTDPGQIVASGLPTLAKAAFSGLLLYLRNRKPRNK